MPSRWILSPVILGAKLLLLESYLIYRKRILRKFLEAHRHINILPQ